MKTKRASHTVIWVAVVWVTTIWLVPVHVFAQAPTVVTPSVITMNEEPHHHRELHNEYVNVLTAKVAPGDSVLLHRHDHDAVAIAIGDQQVTVSIPGKPDVHQKNSDGQVRIQPSGYIHSTHVDGPDAYHTVAVELLLEQTGKRNLCAPVMAGQPLNCPEASTSPYSPNEIIQPQFVSDQTRIEVLRILPHQSVEIGHWHYFQFIVALDPASISPASGKGPDQMLQPGDFIWFDKDKPSRVFKNDSDKEIRFVELQFTPIGEPTHWVFLPIDRRLSEHVAVIGMQSFPPRPALERF
jgi:hypothetical protein